MSYLPEHDTVTDLDELRGFVERHPLASLVTHDGVEPHLDLIPMLWDQRGEQVQLIGHIARANPLWLPGHRSGPVLASFGPVDHYVSPTWYPSKGEHHRVVPTWNYLVVHARGELTVHDDARWVRGVVARLTTAMEQGRAQPWRMGQAPAGFIEEQLTHIIGISIDVASVVGRFKVSAARTEADRHGAMAGIASEADPRHAVLLEAMRNPPQGTSGP